MPFEDPDATEFQVTCPYCGERVEIYLEPDVMGTLVMDCEVCCQPFDRSPWREIGSIRCSLSIIGTRLAIFLA